MSLRCFSTLSPAGTRDRNVTPFPLRRAWAGPTSGLAQARHLSSIAMSLVVGKWAQLEGVAPSTPGDGPRTTAPDRFGIRDAQPAPTERRPPPQRKADYIHGTGFLPVPFVDGDRDQLEGVAPSTPGNGPRTTPPDRFGIRDAQPAPTERRPPPQRKPDFVHRTGFLPVPFVDGDRAQLEGVAPSTPGDGPRTTAPDRFGICDAQPAPTERRPPPQRKPDFIHRTGFLPVPFVDGDRAQLEGVAPSTPGDGPRTTAPDLFGARDAQPAPTERRPPPQRKADYIHGTGFLPVLRLAWTFLVLVGLPGVVSAETTWRSAVTGQELRLESFEPIPPAPAGTRVPLALYLLHLAAPRNGTVPDATLIGELRAQGLRVVTVDFQGHAQARVPFLNRDLHGLRTAVQAGTLGGPHVDLARVYVVPSGHRLTRDLISAREAGRTLAFDLIAPAAPLRAPGVVLEFSCDNANRMGNASLQICSDTLLDAAASEGWAVAMADHPVAAPYKGIDAMPSSALRAKAALRSVRKESVARGANGRIVPVGFSRGSGMALLLATTAGRSEFEGYGEAADVESSVQGAVVLSGRFTYLDLLPTDPMIPRYEKAWGTAAQQPDTWRRHGALDYATQALGVPLFLSINLAESPEALHQMSVLRRTLTAWNSPFVFQPESDGRGHKVPLDPAVLTALFRFLSDQLQPGAAPDGATSTAPAVARPSSL